jgi:hypothetical protein
LTDQPVLFFAGFVISVTSSVVIESMLQTLSPARIVGEVGHLKGCGESFLAGLPDPEAGPSPVR